MDIHTLNDLLAQMSEKGNKYFEFIRVPALSVGVYRLEAGAKDEQRPHSEDEVYYVIKGQAKFDRAGKVQEVRPGSILFVQRGVEHRFLDITRELVMLVVAYFIPHVIAMTAACLAMGALPWIVRES